LIGIIIIIIIIVIIKSICNAQKQSDYTRQPPQLLGEAVNVVIVTQ